MENILNVLEVIGILGNVDTTVRSIVSVGQFHTQRRIEEFHELSCIIWGE